MMGLPWAALCLVYSNKLLPGARYSGAKRSEKEKRGLGPATVGREI